MTSGPRRVSAFAPGGIGNVGPGLDVLGLAVAGIGSLFLPANRKLLRVTLEQAEEAERLFSVLMGDDVERRRQYIEEHALEVKNLDV